MIYEPSRRAVLALVAVAGLGMAGPAAADDIYGPFATPHAVWSIFAGATHTDNATLAPDGPSDTIATAGLAGSLYRDTGRLKAALDGSVRYEDYTQGTFESHVLGSLVANATYAFVPERFFWVLEDTYGQVNLDPLLPVTPQNRINANYLVTGPEGDLRLGGTVDLLLGARYSEADFASNPVAQVDNHSVAGKLGLRFALSGSSSVSLNTAFTRVTYRVDGSPSYDQADAFVRFDARSPRGGIAFDGGVSQLRDEGVNTNHPLVRLTAFHRLTPSWNVNLSAGTELQNSGQALQAAFGGQRVLNGQLTGGSSGPGSGGGTPPADINLSLAPFRSDYASLSFDYVRPRTTLDLAVDATRQRYQAGAGALDRNTTGGRAGFTRRLRPTLDFTLSGSVQRRTPTGDLPGDDTKTGRVGLAWRAGALLAVTLEFSHEERSTDSGGFPYTVNLAYLGLSYGPPRPRVAFETPVPAGTTAPKP